MTGPMTLQSSLIEINEDLRLFLSQVEEQIRNANEYSAETYARFKECLAESYREWQEIAHRARTILRALPAEITQRKISHELKQTLEKCEANIRSWYQKIFTPQGHDNAAKTELHAQEIISYLKDISIAADQLIYPLHSLQAHPLWLKFSDRRILAPRNQLQWPRKFFHVGVGLFGVWFYGYSGFDATTVTWVLACCLGVVSSIEVLRRIFPSVNQKICETFQRLMREKERNLISSVTWFMFSMLIVLLVFPKEVGVMALLFTTIGDTAAGIVGSRWGKHRLSRHVSLEGCIAAFLACLGGTLLLFHFGLGNYHLHGVKLWGFSALAALAATLAECSFKKLDDNLVIPLISAPAIWLLMRLF